MLPKGKTVLHHYWRSSASWRVRWALNLKGIKWESVAVNLLDGAEKSDGYARANPSRYVPTLEIDGVVLGESMAILEYLEETRPKPSFFAGDAALRALTRQVAETVNSGIQPLHNLDVLRMVSGDQAAQMVWAKHWVERGLGVVERLLSALPPEARGGRFCVGDEPTLADLCLIPQVYNTDRFGVDKAQFPRCAAIYAAALATPECAAAHPDRWKI